VTAAVDAGAEFHHHLSVADLIRRDDRVVGVRAITTDRPAVDLGAPLVIGADGTHSTIARCVGAAFSRVGQHASATAGAYWSGLVADGYEWIFGPHARSGIIPTNDGDAYVFASASPSYLGRGGAALIHDVIVAGAPELAPRLREMPRRPPAPTPKGRRGFIRRSHGPGWALVGDAGYFKDPLSPHGFTDALRDAELLARAVLAGLDDPSSLDDAIEHYQDIRDRLGIPVFDVVDRIASHQWDHAELCDLLLQLGSAMTEEVETLAAPEAEQASGHRPVK
jgi:flavin-dependent dehydrogenase